MATNDARLGARLAVKRFLNLLPKDSGHYGFDSFNQAFERLGYKADRVAVPTANDVVVMWNRYGANAVVAAHFERKGGRVVVVENGCFSKHWRGAQWYAMALGHHNGAGRWPDLGPGRWLKWAVPLAPWRDDTGEMVVLGQRGIGENHLRSPEGWERLVCKQFPQARLRKHPGPAKLAMKAVPLEHDLRNASEIVTWASSAAMLALTYGIPVFYDCRVWIGQSAARHLNHHPQGPLKDDALRLKMFERMSWAMWTRDEIATGEPLSLLLEGSVRGADDETS